MEHDTVGKTDFPVNFVNVGKKRIAHTQSSVRIFSFLYGYMFSTTSYWYFSVSPQHVSVIYPCLCLHW